MGKIRFSKISDILIRCAKIGYNMKTINIMSSDNPNHYISLWFPFCLHESGSDSMLKGRSGVYKAE